MEKQCQEFKFKGAIWLYAGKAAWHFVTIDPSTAKRIRTFIDGESSAWGSIKVAATIRDYSWQTSLFPDRKTNSYLLPLKKQVRKHLGLKEGSSVTVKLHIEQPLRSSLSFYSNYKN